ncbi:uncharacterized protein V1516DRAFT_672376 [Lipomyces oligophaga]|uniref:uncharacterized protein n=1 Tax=Lipomyces oligophaga TaxID=45792 RepID=UPI0034CE3A70
MDQIQNNMEIELDDADKPSEPPQVISLTPARSRFHHSHSNNNNSNTPTGTNSNSTPPTPSSSTTPTNINDGDYVSMLQQHSYGRDSMKRGSSRSGHTPEPTSIVGAVWPQSCEALSSSSLPPKQQVWLIFGATGTIGQAICRTALERGDVVMACSRHIRTLVKVPKEWTDRLETASCDVRSRQMVKDAVEKTVQRWNRIDVVVVSLSGGVIAPCEEQEEHDVRAQFETNLMGLVHVVQATVPFLRLRNRGRYIVFSSIAGMMGVPGLGPFSGTKWACEGLMESLAYEIEPFGCRVTLVYPGTVEQDEMTGKRSPSWRHFVIKPMSNDYRGTPAEYARRMILWISGHRATGVSKIAEIVWELAHCKNPPMRLLMGSESVENMRDKLRQDVEEIEDWKFLFTGDSDD